MYDSYWCQFRHSEKVRKLSVLVLVFVRGHSLMLFVFFAIKHSPSTATKMRL